MKTKLTMVVLAFSALGSMGFASDEKTSVNVVDANIIKETAADGQAEVRMGEIGVRKAHAAPVRALAEKIVSDHMKMDKDLIALAHKKNVDTTAAEESKSASKDDKLEMLNGQDFDSGFLKDLESAHKKAVEKFESSIKKSADPQLKAYLENELPTIQEHLNKIEHLREAK